MYKACIFDLDGTLVDTVESMAYTSNTVLQEFGFQAHPVENYKFYAGDGQYELIKRCLIDAGDKDLLCYNEVMQRYIELFKVNCILNIKLYDGIKELLEELKKRGIKIAVFTNKQHDNACYVLDTLFKEGLFDIILGQKDTHKKKPSNEGAFIIANNLKVEPSECLYIGDTSTDMQTGINAGMNTVGVTWGFRSKEELVTSGAKYIVTNPKAILDLIH